MPQLEWTRELSVGIKEIDYQHKQFIGLINELENGLKERSDKDKLNKTIQKMIDYARKHFTTEENYFEKYNYPFAQEHSIQHIKLLDKVNYFREELFYERINYKEVLEFLKEWLETHLKKHDFKYRDYFVKKGFIKK
jgi:hemerythrin